MMLRIKSSLLIFIGLVSCEKEEIAVAKHVPGDEMVNEIAMEEDYKNQLFFDLGTNEVVSSNLKTEWDLGFQSDGSSVILNSAKGMEVHRSSLTFSGITSQTGLDWNWDAHSGNLDSTAFGDWISENAVYVVDRGYSSSGAHQGYYKIKILTEDAVKYTIQYADISENSPIDLTIAKSTTERFTYFSFDNGLVSIAPPDQEYDLLFTQYTHLFKDPETPYLVSGVLLNRNNTEAALVTEKTFVEITLEDAENAIFSKDINVIGYDWKGYDLSSGQFTTYPEMIYIIKTWNGVFYKLHFTSFYNSQGIKGFPNIEFQEL